MSRTLICFIFLISFNRTFSQKTIDSIYLSNRGYIDSLFNAFEFYKAIDTLHYFIRSGNNSETQLAGYFADLADCYSEVGKFNDAIKYYSEAKKIYCKLPDSAKIFNGYNNIGLLHFYKGNYAEALNHYDSAYLFAGSRVDQQAIIYNNIAMLYDKTGQFEKSVQYYLETSKLLKITNDTINQAKLLNNIGQVYLKMGKLDLAFQYTEKSYKMSKMLNRKDDIIVSLNNLGKIHIEKKDYEQAVNNFDSALLIASSIDYKRAIPVLLRNMSTAYLNMNQPNKALNTLYEASRTNQDLGLESNLVKDYISIGDVYMKLRNISQANKSYLEALKNGEQVGNVSDYYQVLLKLSEINAKKSFYKKAYQYYRQYIELKDSILNIDIEKNIAELQLKYNTAEKEIQALALSNAQKEAALFRLALISSAIIVILIALIGIFKQLAKRKEREMIVRIQEQEKQRNYEFYHNTGNKLVSISQNMELITNQEINELGQAMRSYSHLLYSPDFTHINLEETLKELVVEYEKLLKGKIILRNNLPDKVSKRIRKYKLYIMYRIIQELFQNAVKHSGATKVTLDLTINKKQINATYQDNGKGIETKNMDGKGMKYIKQYINMLNGTIEITSDPAIGFICNFSLAA